jgi:DNA mismatch endonuclease (patch repair protein)
MVRKSKPLTRSELMSRVRSKNSSAEINLRSALHAAGLRFFVHRRIEKVSVDVVFPKRKIAILIDGCFWHGCPLHATYPKTNTDYWLPKLAENKARDSRQTARLETAGWLVLRLWEHDCRNPKSEVIEKICGLVADRRVT